jgi:HAE1 family hydrophobic/amphiphilic exporter-1
MTTQPSYRKVNPADAPVLLLALTSSALPLSQLDAFAQQVISPVLSTIDGVAQVQLYGSQKFAVRIQIDPEALSSRGIGVDELQTAIANSNTNTPLGTLQNTTQALTIQANAQLSNGAQFSDLVIANRGGRPVKLGDVAKVIDSVENVNQASWYDGSRSIVLAVQRQPDANTVDVVDRVKATLPRFESELPGDARIETFNDRSASVRQAVSDVEETLALTIGLVVLVIFVFLRRVTATIIPAVAVPISLIATLGAMYLLNFSIDNISLLGLTLSVGLVVDDAIVMLENIYRHMEEEGKGAFEAAIIGGREIGFTIISISLSLVAVFIPVLLMGGVIGRVFNEFAVVVTISILASAFVSLTLTPMMCSRLLRVSHGPERGIYRVLEVAFDRLQGGYAAMLRLSLRYQAVTIVVFFVTAAASAFMVMAIPKGFFPQEDIGLLSVSTEARQDISFAAMVKLQTAAADVFRRSPYVAHVASTVGSNGNAGGLNAGRMFVELKPKSARPPIEQVLSNLRRQLADVAGLRTFMVPVQNLNVGARASRSQYQYVLQGLDQNQLFDWSVKFADAMQTDPSFIDVSSDLQNKAAQATIEVDRTKADTMGISTDQVRSTLYSAFGARQVSTIYTTGDNYAVIVEFDPNVEWSPDRLGAIRFRTKNGQLVPASAVATVTRTTGPLTVNQLGQLPAVTLSFNLPQGVALSQAVDRLGVLQQQLKMPASIQTSFAGTAKTFQDSLANQGLLISGAVLTIYIVLGILYESFIHPLTILTGLPSAAVGALGALYLFGLDLSVIAIIGLLMLIGIVKKNAIMMIDVALVLRREGRSPGESIYRACLMRFRPILMTTLAALMGTIPIALGAGASAELRQPLGIVVVGGLLVSQVLTLFITPVIYIQLEYFSEWLGRLVSRSGLQGEAGVAKPVDGLGQPAPGE